jgi:hypothetical protein
MADIKIEYGTQEALAITLASLASSTSLLTGRESTAVNNATLKATDYLLSGKIRVGTTPTVNTRIEVWCVGQFEATPAWPDTFTGSDAGVTLTGDGIKASIVRWAANLQVDSTTSDRDYYFGPVSVRDLFGSIPERFLLFVTHNTGVALNATGSNHALYVRPVFHTVS